MRVTEKHMIQVTDPYCKLLKSALGIPLNQPPKKSGLSQRHSQGVEVANESLRR